MGLPSVCSRLPVVFSIGFAIAILGTGCGDDEPQRAMPSSESHDTQMSAPESEALPEPPPTETETQPENAHFWSLQITFDSGWEYDVDVDVEGALELRSDVSQSPPGSTQLITEAAPEGTVATRELLAGRQAPEPRTGLAAIWSDARLDRDTYSTVSAAYCGWGVGKALGGAWQGIRLPIGTPGLVPNTRGGYNADQNTFAWDAFLAFSCVIDRDVAGLRSDDLDEVMVDSAIGIVSTIDPEVYVLSVTIDGYHPSRQNGTERCSILLFPDGTVSPNFRIPMTDFRHFTNDCEAAGPNVVSPESLGMSPN